MSADAYGGVVPVTCEACGMDLTPTPEQIRALLRFGNPLRRQPCLETENGLHIVPREAGQLCTHPDCGGLGRFERSHYHYFDR